MRHFGKHAVIYLFQQDGWNDCICRKLSGSYRTLGSYSKSKLLDDLHDIIEYFENNNQKVTVGMLQGSILTLNRVLSKICFFFQCSVTITYLICKTLHRRRQREKHRFPLQCEIFERQNYWNIFFYFVYDIFGLA